MSTNYERALQDAPRNGSGHREPPPGFETPEGPVDLREYGVNEFTSAANRIAEPLRQANLAREPGDEAEVRGLPRDGDGFLQGFEGLNLEEQAEKIERESEAAERFPVVTTRELMTTKYTRTWLIFGILVQGGFGIMVAPLKTLKTSLALLMAVSLCVGCKLFDMFTVPEKRRVGFMSGEADPITIQDTLGRICASLRITAEGIDNLFFSFSVPRLDVDADLIAVEKFITDNRLEVLFLDCFYFMLGEYAEKASNLFAMGALLRKLLEIQMRTGCTILMLHHMPKHTACGEPALDQAAFAGVSECARQWILLNRMEPFDPAAHEMLHKLWFVAGGSAGHCASVALEVNEGRQDAPGGRHWALTAAWAHEARQEMAEAQQGEKEQKRLTQKDAELSGDTETIMALLRKVDQPETKTGIRDRSGLSVPRFNRAFAAMLDSKSIGEIEIVKGNNRRYEAFGPSDRLQEYRNRQQQSAPVNPMLTDAVASEQSTPLIGVTTDATPCDCDSDAAPDAKPDGCEPEASQ